MDQISDGYSLVNINANIIIVPEIRVQLTCFGDIEIFIILNN